MAAQVLVIGSANADLVVPVERRPRAGETVLGGDLSVAPGGKGANQAVAAARLGARVAFAGCLGRDAHGQLLLESLSGAGVDVSGVRHVDGAPTGVALISVTPDGDNAIIVSPGANAHVDVHDVRRSLAPHGSAAGPADAPGTGSADAPGTGSADAPGTGSDVPRVVVLQLELPIDVVSAAVRLADDAGARVVLNLAPPAPLAPDVLRRCDPLVLNEHEAATLLRRPSPPHVQHPDTQRPDTQPADVQPADVQPPQAQPQQTQPQPPDAAGVAAAVLALGPRSVVLTMAAAGAVLVRAGITVHVAAARVSPVDTTGAGDALTGALAARLAAGDDLVNALRFAVRVATTATLRPGAQPSFPFPDEVLPPQPAGCD